MRRWLPLLLLCACAAQGPDAYELANIRPWNIVPLSSPARLVGTFEKVCLDGPTDPDRAAAALRAMDYVEVPGPGPIRSFAVDDNRPAVMISATACAVGARSRTGQTERIRAMVATRYPQAEGFIARGIEQGWRLPSGDAIALRRLPRPGGPNEMILMRLRGPTP